MFKKILFEIAFATGLFVAAVFTAAAMPHQVWRLDYTIAGCIVVARIIFFTIYYIKRHKLQKEQPLRMEVSQKIQSVETLLYDVDKLLPQSIREVKWTKHLIWEKRKFKEISKLHDKGRFSDVPYVIYMLDDILKNLARISKGIEDEIAHMKGVARR